MQAQPPSDSSSSTHDNCYRLPGVELHLTSPLHSSDLVYSATGFVRLESTNALLEGGFVRIRSLVTGFAEETFLDRNGAFAEKVELQPNTDNALEFAICDGFGRELARVVAVVQHPGRDSEGAVERLPAKNQETSRSPMLDPPWPRFARLVERCLRLAAEVADKTSRDSDELCDHIHAQERYAEQAYEERNQPLYHECKENLEQYHGYLAQLLGETLPRPRRPSRPPEDEARAEIDRFRADLSAVWKQVRDKNRSDLEAHLTEIAAQARGLSQRVKNDPLLALREANRLGVEVEKVAELLHPRHRQAPGDESQSRERSL
ncbi:MAG TPA: hypothetical protein VH592_09770 [Gemmataceae bacterium]|jgi:hypothetical protein